MGENAPRMVATRGGRRKTWINMQKQDSQNQHPTRQGTAFVEKFRDRLSSGKLTTRQWSTLIVCWLRSFPPLKECRTVKMPHSSPPMCITGPRKTRIPSATHCGAHQRSQRERRTAEAGPTRGGTAFAVQQWNMSKQT